MVVIRIWNRDCLHRVAKEKGGKTSWREREREGKKILQDSLVNIIRILVFRAITIPFLEIGRCRDKGKDWPNHDLINTNTSLRLE